MDDLEIVEVTKKSTSKKPEVRPKQTGETPDLTVADGSLLRKVAQIKRRLEFCEKEREILSKKFKQLETQLDASQKCELNVKTEDSKSHTPMICIGDDSDDDDVIFIPPEDYSPRKRQKLQTEKLNSSMSGATDTPSCSTEEISMTVISSGINLPHARADCKQRKFVLGNVTAASISCNELSCDQCYCYVCDVNVKECNSWKTGGNPHCNAFAKNAFWEKLRKESKRKKACQRESLLQCLPQEDQTDEIKKAALEALDITQSLKTIVDSLNNNSPPSSPESCDCGCFCHDFGCYDDDDYCRRCSENHEDRFSWTSTYYVRSRIIERMEGKITDAVTKSSGHLKNNEPKLAAVVLDAITNAFLSTELDSEYMYSYRSAASNCISRLKKVWIEVMLHPEIPSSFCSKLKERLKNSIEHATEFCSGSAKSLLVVTGVKQWDDRDLMKCLAGEEGHSQVVEKGEIIEARLQLFDQQKRYNDAINYMTTAREESCTSGIYTLASPAKTIASILKYRRQLMMVLAKAGKVEHAVFLCILDNSAVLPQGFLQSDDPAKKYAGRINSFGCRTLLHEINFSSFKDLLGAVIGATKSADVAGYSPATSAVYPKIDDMVCEKAQAALALILSGVQINSSFRTYYCLEWFLEIFCQSSATLIWTDNYQESVHKEVFRLLKKAKKQPLKPEEIRSPSLVPLKVFAVKLLAALVATVHVASQSQPRPWTESSPALRVMGWFKRKDLYWACVTMLVTPNMQESCDASHINFALDNVLPKYGSGCIPYEVYLKWAGKLKGSEFESLLKLARHMMKEGKAVSGTKGKQLMERAVKLAWKITNTIANNHKICGKDKLIKILCEIKDEFSQEGKKYGFDKFEIKILELNFKFNPSFENLEALKNVCKPHEWTKSRINWLNNLKHSSSQNKEACIEVFGLSEMFSELKTVISGMPFNDDYPGVCKKIKTVLEKLKESSDKNSSLFASACSSWLAVTLCKSNFNFWKRRFTTVSAEMTECMKAVHKVSPAEFESIMKDAINQVCTMYCNNTVFAEKRKDLREWLKYTKTLYLAVGDNLGWSREFSNLTTGTLKRKPAVIRELTNCFDLLKGNLPWREVVKIDIAKSAEVEAAKAANKITKKDVPSHTSVASQGTKVPLNPSTTSSVVAIGTQSLEVTGRAPLKELGSSNSTNLITSVNSLPKEMLIPVTKSLRSQPQVQNLGTNVFPAAKGIGEGPAVVSACFRVPQRVVSTPQVVTSVNNSGPTGATPSAVTVGNVAATTANLQSKTVDVSSATATTSPLPLTPTPTYINQGNTPMLQLSIPLVPLPTVKQNGAPRQHPVGDITAQASSSVSVAPKPTTASTLPLTTLSSSSLTSSVIGAFQSETRQNSVGSQNKVQASDSSKMLQNIPTSAQRASGPRDVALLKITPAMAQDLAKGLTVHLPADIAASNGISSGTTAGQPVPSLRKVGGKIMMTISTEAAASLMQPNTSSVTASATNVGSSLVPGRPANTGPTITPANTGATIAAVLPTNTGPTIASVLPTNTGPTIAAVLPTNTGPTIASVLPTNTGPTVVPVPPTNIGPTIAPVPLTNTGATIAPVPLTNTGATIASVPRTTSGRKITSVAPTTTGPTIAPVPLTNTSTAITPIPGSTNTGPVIASIPPTSRC